MLQQYMGQLGLDPVEALEALKNFENGKIKVVA